MVITDLDSQIRTTFSRKSKLYSVFFDRENAIPRVWKHLISKTLHLARLKGPLPLLLKSFLENRSFRVRIGSHHYSTHPMQENGIHQGSSLSGTLFILVINNIVTIIPPAIKIILYVDNLSIHLMSSNPSRAARHLQSPSTVFSRGAPFMASSFPL